MNRVASVPFILMSLCVLVSCGTLEIGVECTMLPTHTFVPTTTSPGYPVATAEPHLGTLARATATTTTDDTAQTPPAETSTRTMALETLTPTALSSSATSTWAAPAPTVMPSPPPQTPAPAIARPVISFIASPSPADPTGAVTLDWNVRGSSSVTIQWLDKRTEGVIHAGLPLMGSMSVDLLGVKFSEGNAVRFSLSLYDAEGALMVGADGQPFIERLTIPLQTEMTIASFTASPDPIERGGTVTLAWDAPNAYSVGITRVSPEGVFLTTEARDLPTSGSIALPVPDEFVTSITYYLGARDANGVLLGAYVTVSIACPYDEYFAPQCPLTRGYVHAAYMPFEGGHMLWRGDTNEIYVLYTDGTYQAYEDTWVEGEIVEIEESPPQGLVAPRRGFGKLWATQLDVRDKLGWATAEELGYTMLLETVSERGIDVYLALPDGRVLLLDAFSSRWEIVPLLAGSALLSRQRFFLFPFSTSVS